MCLLISCAEIYVEFIDTLGVCVRAVPFKSVGGGGGTEGFLKGGRGRILISLYH